MAGQEQRHIMISSSDMLHGSILIVDDQEANIVLLEKTLRGKGYQSITSTQDPAKVCELHLIHHYDLILLDLQMPGMDGFQLRALNAGARDFLSKPFDLAEVLIRVHNVLEVRLLHMELTRLYDRVIAEQKTSEQLLLNVLPHSIDAHPKGHPLAAVVQGTELVTETSAEVTVLFADIMDAAIGDAYLAAVGMPDAVVDQSTDAARLASARSSGKSRNGGPREYLEERARLRYAGPLQKGSSARARRPCQTPSPHREARSRWP